MERPDSREIQSWLREEDPARLEELFRRADEVRRRHVGDSVFLRGLIEISNHCVRQCAYCGIRGANRRVERYRMTDEEILACARRASELGYGTVVLQAGEDPGLKADWVANLVEGIKRLDLAVTLSLGERTEAELALWRSAGADRYLLRFETSDPELFARIHPPLPGRTSDRFALLERLRALGFEIGSGIMVGIPGQTYASVARDIERFSRLDLDMIGIGPYLPHPETPLAHGAPRGISPEEQVPNTEQMVYKVLALTRLTCPEANLPSTTALAILNQDHGRTRGLGSGANIVMPNLTPAHYRIKYEIYPGKAGLHETAEVYHERIRQQIESLGRAIGRGAGGRRRGAPQID